MSAHSTAAPRRTLIERRPDDRRLVRHHQDQARMAQLEAVLADCVRYIATTYDSETSVVSFAGTVAPRHEPSCSIAAKRLLGWTLG